MHQRNLNFSYADSLKYGSKTSSKKPKRRLILLSIIVVALVILFVPSVRDGISTIFTQQNNQESDVTTVVTNSQTSNATTTNNSTNTSTTSTSTSQTNSNSSTSTNSTVSTSTIGVIEPNPCPNEKLKPIKVQDKVFCTLEVPYTNQNLNSQAKFEQDPSGKGDVRMMCAAAANVMVAGYYGKIKYTDYDDLREHLYKAKSAPALQAGAVVNVAGYNIKLCMDGAFALTSYSLSTGKSMCNYNNNVDFYLRYFGLKSRVVTVKYADIVKELKLGNPIVFNLQPHDQLAGGIYESHYVVIKGYNVDASSNEVLLNDPYSDMTLKSDGKCMGLTGAARLKGENSIYNTKTPVCARSGMAFAIYK